MRGQVAQAVGTDAVFSAFKRMDPPEFAGSTDPLVAVEWVKALEAIFDHLQYEDKDRISCAVFMLIKLHVYGGMPLRLVSMFQL